MGGVEVLHPQNLLKDRLSHHRHRHRSIQSSKKFQKKSNPNPNPKRNSYLSKSNRRMRIPQNNSNNRNSSTTPTNNHALVMGQVKILKRGELLNKDKDLDEGNMKISSVEDLMVLSSTDRLGPEPDMIPNKIRVFNFFAGSAIISSPPPSCLPKPVFFKKKNLDSNIDNATNDLRKLLRLDLD